MKTALLITVMAFSSVSFAKGNPTGCTKGLVGSTTSLSRQQADKVVSALTTTSGKPAPKTVVKPVDTAT